MAAAISRHSISASAFSNHNSRFANYFRSSIISEYTTDLATRSVAAICISVTTLFPYIFESILRAVPKKKQSHSRKRMRQMAGKALKDVLSINTCSGCGRPKRAHFLCPYCAQEIRDMWAGPKSGSNSADASK